MSAEQAKKSIRLVQFTDCHLQADPEQGYKGYYPEQRLDSVIADIGKRSTELGHFDHLIMSGDLAQFGANSVYQRLLEKTQNLAANRHWLPGNHDDVSCMSQFTQMNQKVIKQGDWAIVLLDSTSRPDGVGSGALSDVELDLLTQSDQLDARFVFIVLHHPPITVNSHWQDQIKLSNSDQFWQVLSRLKKVRGISFGHLHQELERVRDGVKLFCTPATSYQYKAEQVDVTIEDDQDLAKAGYRLLELHSNGDISTLVLRVP